MGQPFKSLIGILFRIAISLLLIFFLLSRINLEDVIRIILGVNAWYLPPMIVLSLISLLILAYRWNILLKIFYPKIRYLDSLKYFWIGQFFSLFLPGSTIGGDVFRAYKVSKYHGKPIQGMIVGVTDRLIGLCAIAILATPAIILGRYYFSPELLRYLILVVVVFWAALLMVLAYVFLQPKTSYLQRIFDYLKRWKIFHDIYDSMSAYKEQIGQLYKSLWLSLCATILSITAAYLLALSIGISVTPLYFYSISSFVFIFAALPVSINGLGLLDGAYVFFLGQVGIPAAAALSLSLSMHCLRLLINLTGGIVYIIDKQQ